MAILLELPEEIILDIVSELDLTNKEAIMLSLVSKKFSDIMQKRNKLAFNPRLDSEDRYQNRNLNKLAFNNLSVDSDARYQNRYRRELDYMVSTLKRYHEQKIPLAEFWFSPDTSFLASMSDEDAYEQCIELCTKKNLKILSLTMPLEKCYVVGQSVFEVESLEFLNLNACTLHSERITAWRNLREMILFNVEFDENLFENIIRGCPLIECLSISKCCNNIRFYKFKVGNLLNLRELDICGIHDQSFELMNAVTYQNLKKLDLQWIRIDDNVFTDFAKTFPQIESLSIKYIENLQIINLSSTSVKAICLENNDKLQKIDLNLPNVVHFVLISETNNIPKLSFTGNSNGWISHIKFIVWYAHLGFSWFLDTSQLLSALKGSEISLVYTIYKVSYDEIHEINDGSIGYPEIIKGIQDISIETRCPKFSLHRSRWILDGIFRICRPKKIKFLHNMRQRHEEDHTQFHELFPKTDGFLELLKAHEKDSFSIGFNLQYLK